MVDIYSKVRTIKRKFVRYGITKHLVDIPDKPKPVPPYATMWKEHKSLSKLFVTKNSFFGWTQRYHYKDVPAFEQVVEDRLEGAVGWKQ